MSLGIVVSLALGNPFGAASALAVILAWVYYAGVLVLAGAEFTQQYALARGHGIRPKRARCAWCAEWNESKSR